MRAIFKMRKQTASRFVQVFTGGRKSNAKLLKTGKNGK